MMYERAFIDSESRGAGAPLRFVLSTPGIKRDGLSLDMRRMRTDSFNRNPVMLWQHGRDIQRGDLPIGRWANVRVNQDGELIGEAEFDGDDKFALDVERKYRMGYLNAVSISWQYRDEGQMEWYDLLEASAVAVPADPDALMDGRSVVLTSKEYEKLVEGTERLSNRIESLEREVQAERARAAAIHALRSL